MSVVFSRWAKKERMKTSNIFRYLDFIKNLQFSQPLKRYEPAEVVYI